MPLFKLKVKDSSQPGGSLTVQGPNQIGVGQSSFGVAPSIAAPTSISVPNTGHLITPTPQNTAPSLGSVQDYTPHNLLSYLPLGHVYNEVQGVQDYAKHLNQYGINTNDLNRQVPGMVAKGIANDAYNLTGIPQAIHIAKGIAADYGVGNSTPLTQEFKDHPVDSTLNVLGALPLAGAASRLVKGARAADEVATVPRFAQRALEDNRVTVKAPEATPARPAEPVPTPEAVPAPNVTNLRQPVVAPIRTNIDAVAPATAPPEILQLRDFQNRVSQVTGQPVQDVRPPQVPESIPQPQNAAAVNSSIEVAGQQIPVTEGQSQLGRPVPANPVQPGEANIRINPGRPLDNTPPVVETPQHAFDAMNQAVDLERNRYNRPTGEKLKSKALSQFDPLYEVQKIDMQQAKAAGVPYRMWREGTQSLTGKYDAVRNFDSAVNQFIEDTGLGREILQKYTGQAENDFMNYVHAKMALEVYNKNKIQFLADANGSPIPIDALKQAVKEYEGINPEAITDAKKVKGAFDELNLRAADGADPLVSKAEAQKVNDSYEFFSPIEHVLAQDLERPSVGASPIGSIGRQTILQRLEGSNRAVDNTFGSLNKRIASGIYQIKRNDFSNALRKASAPEGGTLNARYLTDHRDVAARLELKGQMDAIQGELKKLNSDRSRTSANVRVVGRDFAQAKQAAISKARSFLTDITSDNPDARAAIGEMKSQDLINLFNDLVSDNVQGLERLRGNLVRKGGKYNALASQLQDIRGTMTGLKNANNELRQNFAELAPDPSTGKQTFSGFTDGLPFKMEVSPEVARVVQGLDGAQKEALAEIGHSINRIYKTGFTGFMAPIFTLFSGAIFDPTMAVVNSRVGWKLFTPTAVKAYLTSFKDTSELRQALNREGAMTVTGTMMPNDSALSAAQIQAGRSVLSKAQFYFKNPKEALHAADILGGKLSNAVRETLASVHAKDAYERTGSLEEAVSAGVYAYNNISPNFRRVSSLVRSIDAAIPYTAASIAGTRSFLTALRHNPDTLVKLGLVGVGIPTAVVAHNMASDEGKAFYEDMMNSGKSYVLDTNNVIVLPGAYKDEKTGQWHGIIKIPMAPELRPINRVVWRQAYDAINGNGLTDPKKYAGALFDVVTGGLRQGNNPALSTAIGLATNTNLLYNSDIVPVDPDLRKTFEDKAPGLDRIIAKALGVDPLQVQFVMSQFGTGTKELENVVETGLAKAGVIPQDQVIGNTLGSDIKDRLTKVYGNSAGKDFYNFANQQISGIKDQQDRKLAEAMVSKNGDKTFLDSPQKALTLLNSLKGNGQLFNFAKSLDARERSLGKPGNPFWDLSPDQQQKVLLYQSSRTLRDTKQDYTKQGVALFNELGLDQGWYKDYQTKNSAFYKALNLPTDNQAPQSLSGQAAPKMSDQQQAWMNEYSALPSGTGDRSAWIKSHPSEWAQLTDYFNKSDAFANAERAQLGLSPLPTRDSEGNLVDSKGNIVSSGGSSGGGSSHSHPPGSKWSVDANGKFFLTPAFTPKMSIISSAEPTKGKIKVKAPAIQNISVKKVPTKVPKRATKLV